MLEPQPFKASKARLRKFSRRLANDLAELSNDLARLANDLIELSNDLARPANDSINGVFDEKSKKLPFLAAAKQIYGRNWGYSTSPMARFVLLK